jgi:branched-chain amino acid transport system ATP-binding protein
MLKISELETGYRGKQVLFGLSMQVAEGEIVAIIGPNGAGKSTVLKAACGLISSWKGEVRFNGLVVNGSLPAQNIAYGITFAPQGGRVFDTLTVMDNLKIGGFHLSRRRVAERISYVLDFFPLLKDHVRQNAGTLSGGERQMLALARALVPEPKLLLLDEPSLGLSPNLVCTVFERLIEINRVGGLSILVVEQKVNEVLNICNRVYSLKLGNVAYDGSPDDLKADKSMLKDLFL